MTRCWAPLGNCNAYVSPSLTYRNWEKGVCQEGSPQLGMWILTHLGQVAEKVCQVVVVGHSIVAAFCAPNEDIQQLVQGQIGLGHAARW